MPKTKRAASRARKNFGVNLRAARHARSVTLEDLAELADMNWSYIASVERGERNIGIDNMQALADALEVDLRELLNPLSEKKPSSS